MGAAMGKIQQPDWTALPKDIVDTIPEFLDRQSDVDRLRAVCKRFQSSAPPRPKLPQAYSSYTIPFPESTRTSPLVHLLLTQSTIFAIQPREEISIEHEDTAKTWVIKIEKSETGIVQLRDPLTEFSFLRLSSSLPRTLNLLDYHVEEITKAYGLEVVVSPKCKGAKNAIDLNTVDDFFFQKVAVSSCFAEEDERFTVIAIYGISNRIKLGFWRKMIGRWIKIVHQPDYFRPDDVVYCDRKFYVVSTLGDTISVDCESLVITEVAAGPQREPRDGYRSLVKSPDNCMFLVTKYFSDALPNEFHNDENTAPIDFYVCKLDEEHGAWVLVNNELENQSLFVGKDCSFCLSTKKFTGCLENCIYFPDSQFIGTNRCHPGWFAGIYDLDDDSITPLSVFPSQSRIFWPPPSWVNHNYNSSSRW